MPSASTVTSEPAVRAEEFLTGPPYCRGGPGQRHQGQRGPRRGGRARAHPARYAPVTEQLDKLSLSADGNEGPTRAKPQGDQEKQGVTEVFQPNNISAQLREQEPALPPDDPLKCSPYSETELLREMGEPESGGGRQARRRGPRRSAQHPRALRGPDQWDRSGPPRHHWEGRGSRSRGVSGNQCRGGGGPRRGHGRGYYHKTVERERGREEVL